MSYRIPAFRGISRGRMTVFLGEEIGELQYKYSRGQKRLLWFFVPHENNPHPGIANELAVILGSGRVHKSDAITVVNRAVANLTHVPISTPVRAKSALGE